MNTSSFDPEYVAARRVLLDALFALQAHAPAVIVAGAQAVYLRTGSADLSIAPFTTDGDLAIDPSQLGGDPTIEVAMETGGFALHKTEGGHVEPGMWVRSTVVHDHSYLIPVDLIVPNGAAAAGGRRGARLGAHGNRAARRAVGLEAALIDHDPMQIDALETIDRRSITVEVAGVAALLIAKAHKIHDRIEANRQGRVVDKDAADVFRLMQTSNPVHTAATIATLRSDPLADATTVAGIAFLVEQFRRPASPGVQMASAALRLGVPEARVTTVCNTYISTLIAAA